MTELNNQNCPFVSFNQRINFKFDGVKYYGYKGDTIASALLRHGVKLIGRSFNDSYVEKFKKFLSYQITSNLNGDIMVNTKRGVRKPEEISAMVLSKIKIWQNENTNLTEEER